MPPKARLGNIERHVTSMLELVKVRDILAASSRSRSSRVARCTSCLSNEACPKVRLHR